jgi:hypothetical protein
MINFLLIVDIINKYQILIILNFYKLSKISTIYNISVKLIFNRIIINFFKKICILIHFNSILIINVKIITNKKIILIKFMSIY